jgi:hypothetical protein
LEVRKYHRNASAPWRSSTSHGGTMLPSDLDIFLPSASAMWPRQRTVLYGERSNSSVETAISE